MQNRGSINVDISKENVIRENEFNQNVSRIAWRSDAILIKVRTQKKDCTVYVGCVTVSRYDPENQFARLYVNI